MTNLVHLVVGEGVGVVHHQDQVVGEGVGVVLHQVVEVQAHHHHRHHQLVDFLTAKTENTIVD